ncbi:glutamine-hydrolyzing GMP synthase [Candidatus Saccharibacteria bacterium]|nr:MAG: glutamine-hydrolyzing GMP synthase [Candidatus Saccharibacteria bacterium]
MNAPTSQETLVILDYGSQYTQLIARKARELGVYSIILPFRASLKEIAAQNPQGIVLSGGPNSVYEKDAPALNADLFELQVPILGICYGMQLLALNLGGKVEPGTTREYGNASISLSSKSSLIDEKADNSVVWMSHGDHVAKAPEGFTVTAMSGGIICAMEDRELGLFGLQFHPEVAHSVEGKNILGRFFDLCGFHRDWSAGSLIDDAVARIRETVGDANVVCALSGGVDSSVAATLVDKAIGTQQTCIFVDTGLLRANEYEEVLAAYKSVGLNVKPIRASKDFYAKLKDVEDPETKRKVIGAEFIAIFEREARKVQGTKFLVQGTLYPDVIESVSVNGPSVTIKSHHNVGGLPEKMKLKLIEPLRKLFKDEVRELGAALGLPEKMVQRQPFPGPGLAIRIIGSVTPERIDILQKADAIVREEIENHPVRPEVWQFFAVLLPIKSVGVMGDGRTYEQVCAVRAVSSSDGMTADWAKLPHELLAKISSRIVSEVHGINRVVYDITSKPPGTIEWE